MCANFDALLRLGFEFQGKTSRAIGAPLALVALALKLSSLILSPRFHYLGFRTLSSLNDHLRQF